MKITNIRIRRIQDRLNRRVGNAIGLGFSDRHDVDIVEVFTDEGVTGCLAADGMTDAAAYLLINKLKPVVLGEEPPNFERIWRRMFGEERGWVYLSYKGETLRAISVLDTAIWDLIGKQLGMPVYKLLGGYRDKVRCYASAGYYVSMDSHLENLRYLEAEMGQLMDMGFKAVKMRAGRDIAQDCERARVVREVIGPDVDLLIDFNFSQIYRGGVPRTIKFIKALEEYNPFWIEDPLSADDVSGMKQIADAVDTAIAAGEREQTLWAFKDLIVNRAVDIINPDGQNMSGGITEWRRIAALADAYRIPIAGHAAQVAHTHCVASVANGLIVEYLRPDEPCRMAYAKNPQVPNAEGMLELPQTPGLGIELDEDYIQKHLVSVME